MRRVTAVVFFLSGCVFSALLAAGLRAWSDDQGSWNPKAAAAYLDGRAAWWMAWPNAARDHGTFCVSCHTAVPYALARPALRTALGERDSSPNEVKLLDNVVKRVTLWKDVAPFYPDQLRGLPKTSESRATEAILNALILANRDAQTGRLADDTRAALANVWALQMNTGELSGAWAWLDLSSPDVQDNLKFLRGYFERVYGRQHTFNRLMLLWASAKVTGLLTSEQRQSVIDSAVATQQSDGGWSMASLGAWKRIDGSALDTTSDGYATGLVTLALQQAGVSRANPAVSTGLEWLRRNQNRTTGQWPASSLNKQRDPASDIGRFMSDAATAYAVLSLTQAH